MDNVNSDDARIRIASLIERATTPEVTVAVADLCALMNIVLRDDEFRADVDTFRKGVQHLRARLAELLDLPRANSGLSLDHLVDVVAQRLGKG